MSLDQVFNGIAIIMSGPNPQCFVLTPGGTWKEIPLRPRGLRSYDWYVGYQGNVVLFRMPTDYFAYLIDRAGCAHRVSSLDGKGVGKGSHLRVRLHSVNCSGDILSFDTQDKNNGCQELIDHLAIRTGEQIRTVRSRHDCSWWFAGGRIYEVFHWSHRVRVYNQPNGRPIREAKLANDVVTAGDRYMVDHSGMVYSLDDIPRYHMRIPLDSVWSKPLVFSCFPARMYQSGELLVSVEPVYSEFWAHSTLRQRWRLHAWDLRSRQKLGSISFQSLSSFWVHIVTRAQLQRMIQLDSQKA